MKIRPAQEKDRAILTNLHVAEDLESHKEAPEVMQSLRLSELSSRGRDIILVAEEEGEVVGYFWAVALRIFDYRLGLLFYMYVDPARRHRGVGRQLLKEGMRQLHDLGVRRYWANPEQRNTPTRALLESLGFHPGPEKMFYQLVEPGARHEWEKVG